MLLIIPVILSYFPPTLKQADDQHMTANCFHPLRSNHPSAA